jgi:hypothetical protein
VAAAQEHDDSADLKESDLGGFRYFKNGLGFDPDGPGIGAAAPYRGGLRFFYFFILLLLKELKPNPQNGANHIAKIGPDG